MIIDTKALLIFVVLLLAAASLTYGDLHNEYHTDTATDTATATATSDNHKIASSRGGLQKTTYHDTAIFNSNSDDERDSHQHHGRQLKSAKKDRKTPSPTISAPTDLPTTLTTTFSPTVSF
jgi:hypothetical protein